jgi:chemotaxis response regulator CheB
MGDVGREKQLRMKAKRTIRAFPVVCVGGSAGGLDAYTRLLRHLPADMGAAIVIVNHLRTVVHQKERQLDEVRCGSHGFSAR